ncbi:hypothetical protein [Sphingosinicella sp. BN140058]|uniref:hypothetical protein n=1 Tax=Sphingosinicella sp. BN140058 TaxID=1892855 RepID=UPI001012D336|nr:hypothetical protein [Sphingosinicella sp. BN140058]QAY80260.1 hypothetical protein ETR14_26820 [Sphingosinicella sp. BN140058]
MSNVLIGVIGVILLIGLAFGAVSNLGPKFEEARSHSEAGRVGTALLQLSAAVEFRNQDHGTKLLAEDSAATLALLKAEGYLQALPPNAVKPDGATFLFSNGGFADGSQQPIAFTAMEIGTSERARSACLEIERRAGHESPSYLDTSTLWSAHVAAHRRLGCFMNQGSSSYLVYAPIGG